MRIFQGRSFKFTWFSPIVGFYVLLDRVSPS
jgi:hypothetical protein